MTPASRLATAIDILDAILAGDPAGMTLTNWARRARYAGSKDRAAVRDIVFDILRRKRSLLWQAGPGPEDGRRLVLAYAAAEGTDLDAVFSGEGYAPDPLLDEERAGLRPLDGAPRPVALDYPDFLDDELAGSLGTELEPVMGAMQERAPVDLRVNLMRASRDEARAMLAAQEIEAEPVPGAPAALRVTGNPRRINGSDAYREGFVELQDLSSQMVARFADLGPGARVIDYCAGGGGKALALYDQGGGEARIFAHDIASVRMNDLPARAARGGRAHQRCAAWRAGTETGVIRSGLCRCALFGQRIMAPQPGCEMAHSPRGP